MNEHRSNLEPVKATLFAINAILLGMILLKLNSVPTVGSFSKLPQERLNSRSCESV